MSKYLRYTTVLLLIFAAGRSAAFPWDKDMVDQPSMKPQESVAPASPGGVPVEGGETLPAPETEAGMFAAKDAAAVIENPVPATPDSIARGEELYRNTCLVCHGAEGRGDGPVGLVFEPVPVDLNDAYTQDQADGQIFFTLTRGRVAMPFYRDTLTQRQRWDVINYLREAFGQQ
jgi:mono/diheme cytochrome c family protein